MSENKYNEIITLVPIETIFNLPEVIDDVDVYSKVIKDLDKSASKLEAYSDEVDVVNDIASDLETYSSEFDDLLGKYYELILGYDKALTVIGDLINVSDIICDDVKVNELYTIEKLKLFLKVTGPNK